MYSFATQKSSLKNLELIQSAIATDTEDVASAAVTFKIVSASLSANNKFYLDFGEKPPFNFFQTYPVSDASTVVSDGAACEGKYVRPPVWGLCEVTASKVADVRVGDVCRAMLPLGTEVTFAKAHVEPKLGNVVVDRPKTHSAYNTFNPIPSDSVCHPNAPTSGLALTCFPGIITGFGLHFALKHANYYACDTIVVTSASSKVALAFAVYMQDVAGKKVVGYTSSDNRAFCQSTGLYAQVLSYQDELPTSLGDVVMVDISGRGDLYATNKDRVKKLLSIGNASGTADKDSSIAAFTALAKCKMILTMTGGPKWVRNLMNPTQELFLIMDTMQVLIEEWGKEKYLENIELYTKRFCDEASKWIRERKCETEDAIQSAFGDIVQGSVPPSEFVLIDVAKAVAHRK